MKINNEIKFIGQSDRTPLARHDGILNAYKLTDPAPGVLPAGMAADSASGYGPDVGINGLYNWAIDGTIGEGLGFLGYPYLAELAQRSEYRRSIEILAKEMTRKWISFYATGDDEDKSNKINEIEQEFTRLNVQSSFQRAFEQDGFFGRAHIYIDTGSDDDAEIATPLLDTNAKIGIGQLQSLTNIEPIWIYPSAYNSTNPLRPDFYRPQQWYVMGRTVHASRLLTIVSRPVPDLLRPAYMFGGISLSQLIKPYVDNFLVTRQSISDTLHGFSICGIKTNLSGILNGGALDEITSRAQLFNTLRNNRGLMILDKDTEEFFNISVPLSGLDALQSQSQEQMAAVTGIPLVKLLGMTPSGLNASSDGEMRAFYDWIEAQQEAIMRPAILRILRIVQLSLYGEIDKSIGFRFEPLWTLNELDKASVYKTMIDSDTALIQDGVLSPRESRQRLATDETSPYSGLIVDDLPEPGPDDFEIGQQE